jgi:hypothetical protein
MFDQVVKILPKNAASEIAASHPAVAAPGE